MDFKALLNQIASLFQNLNLRQRIVIAVSVFVVVAFLVFLALYKGNEKNSYVGYGVLFDNLSPNDSALIVQQLETDKVPYKLANESTILVPNESVYKERIAVAALGIPKNSKVGFEIFDKQEFGSTDFDQKIKYLRALEGELGRTIESLVPIQKASVKIAIPKESVFTQKQVLPTASVVVEIKPSSKISNKQIAGIKNLVSASVMKLKPENVKLVNSQGVPLGENDGGFEDDLIKNQIAYKKGYESDYENKIKKALAPMVGGHDKVVANVTIEFDFAREDSVSEVYDPNSVPRSEQSVEEKREGYAPRDIGGVPGAVSNIGPVKGLQDDKVREKYSKNTSTTNYEISKKVTNKKDAFATIKRVSAAVVVDGKYERDEKEGKVELKYIPLNKQELKMLDAIVKQTIGYDAKRGDQVSVSNFEFKPLGQTAKVPATQTFISNVQKIFTPLWPFIKYAFALLILFIFYKKVIVPFSEHMLESIEEEVEPDNLEEEAEALESAEDTLEKFHKAKKKVEEQILGVSGDFNEEELRYDVLLEKLRAVASDKSEEVANVLQNMIQGENDFGNIKD